jgi:hypothetical protein
VSAEWRWKGTLGEFGRHKRPGDARKAQPTTKFEDTHLQVLLYHYHDTGVCGEKLSETVDKNISM